MEFIYKEVASQSVQRARKRRAQTRLKSFREPLTLVFGRGSTSIIVAEANTASKDPTAGQTNGETTIGCCQGALKIFSIILKGI